MSESSKQNLMTYWPILVAVVTIAVMFGMYSQRLAAAEAIIGGREVRISTIESAIVDLKVKVERIDANVVFIKERIN